MEVRDRIKEFRRVKASDIAENPLNWRSHPSHQLDAISSVLREIGIAGALVAYHSERNGGALTLIDGHLRRGLSGETEWPVLILDLNDAEADIVLATYDPIAAMADAEKGKLKELLAGIMTDDPIIQEMLSTLAEENKIIPRDEPLSCDVEGGEVSVEDYFVVTFEKPEDAARFREAVGIKKAVRTLSARVFYDALKGMEW